MTGDSRSQPSTASAKCRHDVSEDCPACTADEIVRLTSSLVAAEARGKRLEEALRDIARQKQTDELSEDEVDCADFENAYDIIIGRARAALSQTEEGGR